MNENKNNQEEISEVLVNVNRVTRVLKGGRRFSFSVIVVAGNGKNMVGCGHGKAKEVADARRKASQAARKNMIKVPIYQGRTIHHDVVGRSGAAKVNLRRCSAGTGVIAGGAMRAVFQTLGIKDVVAKSIGSSNQSTIVAATFDALRKIHTPKSIAARRGLAVKDLSTKNING